MIPLALEALAWLRASRLGRWAAVALAAILAAGALYLRGRAAGGRAARRGLIDQDRRNADDIRARVDEARRRDAADRRPAAQRLRDAGRFRD